MYLWWVTRQSGEPYFKVTYFYKKKLLEVERTPSYSSRYSLLLLLFKCRRFLVSQRYIQEILRMENTGSSPHVSTQLESVFRPENSIPAIETSFPRIPATLQMFRIIKGNSKQIINL